MAKLLVLISFILISTRVAAVCPTNIVGAYSGYSVYESWNEGKTDNLSTSLLVVSFDKSMKAKIISKHVSIDDPIGMQMDEQSTLTYTFDKATCTGAAFDVSEIEARSYLYFVVADSGKTLYASKQDLGQNETRLVVLTKQ